MFRNCKNLKIFSFFVIYIISVKCEYVGIEIPDKLLSELYSSYKEALHIDEGTVSFRRVLTDNKKYQIHVMKLNEVNGHKRHNLLIKEENSTNPMIYINNPVETKIPNAYLTYEEFKKALTDRVLRLRKEFVSKVKEEVKTTTMRKKPVKEDVKAKIFLRELIELKQDPKSGVEITNENIATGKPILRSNINTNTENVFAKSNTKIRTNITERLSPIKVSVLTHTKKGVEKKDIKVTKQISKIETSIELPVSVSTKNPIEYTQRPIENTESNIEHTESNIEHTESHIDNAESNTENIEISKESNKREEFSETFESTHSSEVESTTTEAATELSKRTTLSKPLVWMGEDDMQKDDKTNENENI